jgi:hypothetical protein
LRQASRRSWRIGQHLHVRVKFFVYFGTTQMTCLRLMGRKMLVALMMEGKFSGEGIHSIDAEDDLMAAMARELVEKGGVGESADAVWEELKRERAVHAVASPVLFAPEIPEAIKNGSPVGLALDDVSLAASPGAQTALSGLMIVGTDPKARNKPGQLWPTGFVVGEQLSLFG